MLQQNTCLSRALFFFFQAEDGIRYLTVTGVQTCALPISVGAEVQRGRARLEVGGRLEALDQRARAADVRLDQRGKADLSSGLPQRGDAEIGRASCRGRV